jgi:hypothetical protein
MTDWAAIYAPLIGSRIEALKWRPLTCDTPSVVEDFRRSSFSFTGAAEIAFADGAPLFLTWQMISGTCSLVAGMGETPEWDSHSLDSVRTSAEDPWGLVEGCALAEARFYTLKEEFAALGGYGLDTANHTYGYPVTAVRHMIKGDDRLHFFWLAVGNENGVWDQDDLWVAANLEPPNMQDLVEIGSVVAKLPSGS